jgi:hypothetical protein
MVPRPLIYTKSYQGCLIGDNEKGGTVACIEVRNAYKVLIKVLNRSDLVEISTGRWKNNNKTSAAE